MNQDVFKAAAEFVFVKEYVPEGVAEMRMATCITCPDFQGKNKMCGVCGCFLEVKTKSLTNRSKKRPTGETTHCPLGKWGDKETANYYRSVDGLELLK